MSLLNNRRRIIMSASQASYDHDVEGSFPLTFNSNGKPISLYELEGSTSQNGTPGTAQIRTNQLFNKDSKDINNGYMTNMVFDSEGVPTESSIEDAYDISEYIDITGSDYIAFNTGATSLNGIFVVIYNANKEIIAYYDASIVRTMGHTPIIESSAKYIRFVINKSSADTIMVNSGETSLAYEPYYKTVIVPVPVNGTGDKTGNLLDFSSWIEKLQTFPNPVVHGTIEYGSDSVILSASSEGDCYTLHPPTGYIISVKPNTKYTLSWEYERLNTAIGIVYIFQNGKTDAEHRANARDDLRSLTITTNDDTTFLTFRVGISTANGVIKYSNIMFNEGSTALPYEPSGYKIPILTNGKNLFDKSKAQLNKRIVSTTGEIGELAGCYTSGKIRVKPNTEYTISGIGMLSAYTGHAMAFYNADGMFVNKGEIISKNNINTFTTPKDVCFIIFNAISSNINQCQLEEGTTATAYEPYTETTTNIYTDKPLYSGDKISYPENQRTNKTGVLILTGDEKISYNAPNKRFVTPPIINRYPDTSRHEVRCTHYDGSDIKTTKNGGIFAYLDALYIYDDRFDNDVESAAANYKAWLKSQYDAGTPVTIYYSSTEPTTEPITLPEIPTLKGTNVLSVQTEVQPSHGYVRFSNNIPRVKMDDYLYDTSYSKINYAWAKEFLRLRYSNSLGKCSTVYKDGLFGRNYDWNYNESAYFFTKIPKSKTVKYSSIGMCGGFSELTNSFVESGKSSELYKALPYVMLDGINECGVVASVNVVSNDFGTTTGTIPSVETRETLSTMMVVRYILDNFSTASSAVNYIKKYVSIYAPHGESAFSQEVHFMVADRTESYILEFVENDLKVLRDKNYMTNFHLYNTFMDESGHIDFSTVAPYGTGLERYNIIIDNYDSVDSVSTMTDLMLKLNFTNAYKSTTNPVWKTEFAGTTPERTVTADISVYQDIINSARAAYIVRSRNGILWQTCHTAIYNTKTSEMYIIIQEKNKTTQIRRLNFRSEIPPVLYMTADEKIYSTSDNKPYGF